MKDITQTNKQTNNFLALKFFTLSTAAAENKLPQK
jgi:hypothetical protein